jgi:hypothetical protein
MFHHKPKPQPLTPEQITLNKEWKSQRDYLDRATEGIKAYEADVLYVQYERAPLDAFEAQYQKCWEEKDADPSQFIKDMKHLDELGQVLDSTDADLHRENVI